MKSRLLVSSSFSEALRIGNNYGTGMTKLNVISEILRQIPGDGPVNINDTKPICDFVWIDDVVIGIIAVINLSKPGIFNIASGRGTSIGDLIKQTLRFANEEHRQIEVKKKTDSRSCIVLDIADTKRQLGWVPKVPLSEGIRRLLQDNNG